MTTNGEIGTNGSSKVSINRPDLWTANVEYDFGNGLYGQRFTGTITVTKTNLAAVNLNLSASKMISSGGEWFDGVNYLSTDYTDLSSGIGCGFVRTTSGYITFYSRLRDNDRDNAPYDIWVIYKK
jgi:hypothetical protein